MLKIGETLKRESLAVEGKVKIAPIQPVDQPRGYPRKPPKQPKKCHPKRKPDSKKRKLQVKEFHTVTNEKE